MAGQVGALASWEAGLQGTELQLRRCTTVAAHDTVQRGYEHVSDTLKGRVFPASHDELEACQSNGILRQIWVGEQVAGVIAVEAAIEYGVRGWVVIEEVLLPAFRGRGFASVAQGHLAKILAESAPEKILFGTIDTLNEASLRTAQRVGREVISAYWWLLVDAHGNW